MVLCLHQFKKLSNVNVRHNDGIFSEIDVCIVKRVSVFGCADCIVSYCTCVGCICDCRTMSELTRMLRSQLNTDFNSSTPSLLRGGYDWYA